MSTPITKISQELSSRSFILFLLSKFGIIFLYKILTNRFLPYILNGMETKSLYPIRYVSQRTGLTPHVIRAWEKRYNAVVPDRSAKNRRLYCEEDVERLKLLKAAKDAGHTISQLAQLGLEDLKQ